MSFEDIMDDVRQSRGSSGMNLTEMMQMNQSYFNNDYDCDESAVDKYMDAVGKKKSSVPSTLTENTEGLSEDSSYSEESKSLSPEDILQEEEQELADPNPAPDTDALVEMLMSTHGIELGIEGGAALNKYEDNYEQDDDDDYADFYDDGEEEDSTHHEKMEFNVPGDEAKEQASGSEGQNKKHRFKNVLMDSSTHSYLQDSKHVSKGALPSLSTLPTSPPLDPPLSMSSLEPGRPMRNHTANAQSPHGQHYENVGPQYTFQSPSSQGVYNDQRFHESAANFSTGSHSFAQEELYNDNRTNPRPAPLPPTAEVAEPNDYGGHESYDYDHYDEGAAEQQYYEHATEEQVYTEYVQETAANIHAQLQGSKWTELLDSLNTLGEEADEETIAQVLSVPNDRHATPIHVASWKAPMELKMFMLQTLPMSEEIPGRVLQLQDVDGNTPIHLACANLELEENGTLDVSYIEALAAASMDPHFLANWQGDTALHLLLTSPAFESFNGEDSNGVRETAANLVFSILRGTSEWENGDPKGSGIPHTKNSAGATPLHIAAAASVHEEVQLKLLQAAPEAASAADKRGMLPLHYVAACLSSKNKTINVNITFVSELVAAHPESVVHSCRATGDTPLHLLVSNAQKHIPKDARSSRTTTLLVELLLQSESISKGRCDEEAERMCPLLVKNRESLYPLHCCALFNAPPSISRILMRSPFSKKAALLTDPNDATPLHLACASSAVKKSVEQVAVLGTPDAALVMDAAKRTPLHIAIENKNLTRDLIKALVDLNPRAAKSLNSKGLMPMHLALRKRVDDSIVRGLLRTYPKAVKHIFRGERTILHEACRYKVSAACFRLLLKEFPKAARMPDKNGNLPLHIATAYESPIEIIQALLKEYPRAALAQNRNNDVPLHYAASYRATSNTARLLLDAAPDAVLITNDIGETPIECARHAQIDAGTIAALQEKAEEIENEIGHSSCEFDRSGSLNIDDLAEPSQHQMPSHFSQRDSRRKGLGSIGISRDSGSSFEFDVIASPIQSQKPSVEKELLNILGGPNQTKKKSNRRGSLSSSCHGIDVEHRNLSSRREPSRRPPQPSKSFDASDFSRKNSRSSSSLSRSAMAYASRSSDSSDLSSRKRRSSFNNTPPPPPETSNGTSPGFSRRKRRDQPPSVDSTSPGFSQRKRRESHNHIPSSERSEYSTRTSTPTSSGRRKRSGSISHPPSNSNASVRSRSSSPSRRMSMSSADLNYCADIGEAAWQQTRNESQPRRKLRSQSISYSIPLSPENHGADASSEAEESDSMMKKMSSSLLLDDFLVEDQGGLMNADLISLSTDV